MSARPPSSRHGNEARPQWTSGDIDRRAFDGPVGFTDDAINARIRGTVLTAFGKLHAAMAIPGPKFVLFHVMPPHDPYVLGPNGEPVSFPDEPGVGHGSPAEIQAYGDQVSYVSNRLLEATDAIVSASAQPPIILIESDEGFEADTPYFPEDELDVMRARGFAAYSLPGKDATAIPRDLAGVNTLRYVFDQYFGTGLGSLPVKTYTSDDEHPYAFEEIQIDGPQVD